MKFNDSASQLECNKMWSDKIREIKFSLYCDLSTSLAYVYCRVAASKFASLSKCDDEVLMHKIREIN